MPPPRTPLGPISGNRVQKTELSPYVRGQIIGQRFQGASLGQIADAFQLEKSTIQYTVEKAIERPEGHSKPRPGQPKVLSDRDERILLRHIRLHPKDTYEQIKKAVDLKNPGSRKYISTTTIKNVCRKHNIAHWKAKKRPALTEKHVETRFAWAKAHKDWTVAQWETWMWSDECSAERGTGKRVTGFLDHQL
jgi:hypothetical protein